MVEAAKTNVIGPAVAAEDLVGAFDQEIFVCKDFCQ